MPSLDHHTLMTLQLDRWSQDRRLSAYEIEREEFERELAAARQSQRPRYRWKFRLSPFWRHSEA